MYNKSLNIPAFLCVTKHRGNYFTMQLEHAEHTLETIRTLMDRSQRYDISRIFRLLAGGTVLLGCATLGLKLLPFGPGLDFAMVWIHRLRRRVCLRSAHHVRTRPPTR